MAASARPLDTVTLDQLQYLADNDPSQAEECRKLRKELEGKFAQLRAGTLRNDEKLMGAPVPYWKSVMVLDSAKTAAGLPKTPILILHGGRDYQVTEADVTLFQTALRGRSNVVIRTYAKMNHLFQEGEGKLLPSEYFSKKGYVDPKVIDDIARWIKSNR